MKVLVDTSVWSVALRRRSKAALSPAEQDAVRELSTLIDEARASMAGCIRQEVLSGIGAQREFERLREMLQPFDDLGADMSTHERAAELFNRCRASGIQGSHIDFLICAIAREHRIPIFTLDQDFTGYAEVCRVELYRPRDS